MIEATITQDEKEVLKYVRQFAQKEVKPLAREIDRTKSVPQKIIDRMN